MIAEDCERYRTIKRKFMSFNKSFIRKLYGKEHDESSYIENHTSNYVDHISLFSLLIIAAA